jgi:Bacterial alpha-L-rhamnosidase 6 hairpin glycosidase domain
MFKRRDFLRAAGQTTALLLARPLLRAQNTGAENAPFSWNSEHIEVELSRSAPELLSLNIDGLGQALRGANILNADRNAGGYQASVVAEGQTLRVAYRPVTAPKDTPAGWTFEFSANKIVLTTEWSADFNPAPMVLHFNLNQVHSTALGLFSRDGLLSTPALLHFPGQGSMRLTASDPDMGLTYTSDRRQSAAALSLPAADIIHTRIVYTLDVTAIHPDVPGIAGDARFNAFRRNWLNALQLNPELQALANNTASDSCAFCYYEFADIAALTPPLAPGLAALDVLRQTLDRMLDGGFAYGMPAIPDHPTTSSDTWPSMIIAAANCVRAGHSDAWLTANYVGVRGWADSMLATDTSGNGLIKYSVSGNSNTWGGPGTPKIRPSNWWDTIGFGYEDAYANALAYRALGDMVMLARKAGKPADAARYQAAADKLRAHYYDRFFDPATGVLGGWRSADGELHDYYFLFVNGIAIHYGLIAKPQANAIMDKLLAKMKSVGYDKFQMGLPGNLITVTLKDYVHKTADGHIGGGVLADNSDGFQNYENGGATGAYAYFTLAALYDLGRAAEADEILFPMLEGYGKSGFEGRDAKGRSPDWRRWDGTNMGYEGYLTDDYYALFAVPLRQSETRWNDGFRPVTWPG